MSKVISHYRLEEELGQGGMGRVYKVYDLTLDRTVVLKLLAPDLIAEEDSRKRFLREARLASALDHPNICTIYEIAESDNQYFIAMQYIEGKTLKRVVSGRAVNLDTVLAIALQVADALAEAHAKGIIHRDVKSTNIIITPRGQAKVLDFGLAKLMMSDKGRHSDTTMPADELTKLGSPLGTPSYMSPEQARCERVDHRSDVYSFGVVLYEMATGRMPFKADSSVDMMHAVIHDSFKPVRQINEGVPEALATIIETAMAKKPGDRYQSMQRMLEDLQALAAALRLGGQGVPDRITLPYVLPRPRAAGGPVARLFGKLFGARPASDARPAPAQPSAASGARSQDLSVATGRRSLAVLPFRNLSGDPQSDFYGLSLADSLITELAKVPSLIVTPSSRVARYQNQTVDPARVRAEMNVDLVLVGNFLKAGERLRVTAQLINTTGGDILWSEKIDAATSDELAIQDRISERILSGLSKGQVTVDPMQLLKDENEEVRLDAVRTLEYSHDPRALTALVEALRDASLKVKAAAVHAIVGLGDEATGPVIRLLNDSTDEGDCVTARFAAKALGLIGDRKISPVLIEMLRSEDKFVACEAALALGRMGETKALAELTALLEDPNGNIRFAAAEALGQVCDESSREALQKRLGDEDEGVRAKARWALSRLRIASRGLESEGAHAPR
jgi:TolB-like protein/tRNA A-37 threonylcarbamoyl transferase component Bud32